MHQIFAGITANVNICADKFFKELMYKIFQLNMIVIQKQLHGRLWFFSQLDPVDLDKACIDKIYHSQDA